MKSKQSTPPPPLFFIGHLPLRRWLSNSPRGSSSVLVVAPALSLCLSPSLSLSRSCYCRSCVNYADRSGNSFLNGTSDQPIFAPSRPGIAPIITSSMAMQLMAGAQIIDVNQGMKEDRALFGGAQKVREGGREEGESASRKVTSSASRRTFSTSAAPCQSKFSITGRRKNRLDTAPVGAARLVMMGEEESIYFMG